MTFSTDERPRPLLPGTRAGLTPRQLASISRARARLIALVVAGFVALAVLVAIAGPRTYAASATVFLGFQSNAIDGSRVPSHLADSYVTTQIDLIRSRRVRLLVVEQLGLGDDPEARAAFERSDEDSFRRWLADNLLDGLSVRQGDQSRIIAVEYAADDPDEAAATANAFVRAYRSIHDQVSSGSADTREDNYAAYIDELRGKVEQARRQLTAAQQENRVVDVRETDREAGFKRLEDLRLKLNELELREEAARARARRLSESRSDGADLIAQADALGGETLRSLRTRLAELEATRAELDESLGARHPRMKGVEEQIRQTRVQLRAELDGYLRAARAEARSAAEEQTALRRRIESHATEVLVAQERRDRVETHVRSLDAAEAQYQSALERYDDMQGRTELQAPDLSIINWASPPLQAERFSAAMLLVLALFLGGITGISAALLLELADRRVRVEDDIVREIGLPVLAMVPRGG